MDNTTLKANIEKELGLTGMPEAAKNEIISMLAENCLKRTGLAIFDRLGEENGKKFDEIAEGGDYEKAYSFASSVIPDFHAFVQAEIKEEIAEFKRRSGV